MKERIFKDKKLRVREWRLFEVLPLDKDDMDYDRDIEVKHIKPKKPRARKKRPSQVHTEKESSVRHLINDMNLGPELDTVRVYFECSSFVDLQKLMADCATGEVFTYKRDPTGFVYYEKMYQKHEMRCSFWGRMNVTKEMRKFGKHGSNAVPVLSFEYSVAKWWNYASAVNSGDEPSAELLLIPCIQVMKLMKIDEYSSMDFKHIVFEFLNRAELRRMDLSLNFKVPSLYTPSEYVNLISRCMINRQSANRHDNGSISFASESSPYRVIVYDKEKEAKNYYLKSHTGNMRFVYYEDKYGNCSSEPTPGCISKVYDEKLIMRDFYEKNKDKFKNNLRFEVQFRTKFFQEHKLMTTGVKNIDNVIRLGKFYWVELLDQIDEQLNRKNFEYKESQKEPVAEVLTKIQEARDTGVFSRTKSNNMLAFLQDCYSKSWKVVYNEMGRQRFYENRKWLMENFNFDVKVALSSDLPIIRVMESIICSREGRMIRDYKLVPAPIERCVV